MTARTLVETLHPTDRPALRACIAENIRARREACGLSQIELAERLGLEGASARATGWRWEQGRSLSLETIDRLAVALGCTPADLCAVGMAVDMSGARDRLRHGRGL